MACTWTTLRDFNSGSATYKPSSNCATTMTFSTGIRNTGCISTTNSVVVLGGGGGLAYGMGLTQNPGGCAQTSDSFSIPGTISFAASTAINLNSIAVSYCSGAGASWTLTFSASSGGSATVTSSACSTTDRDVPYALPGTGLAVAAGAVVTLVLASAGATSSATTGMTLAIHKLLATA